MSCPAGFRWNAEQRARLSEARRRYWAGLSAAERRRRAATMRRGPGRAAWLEGFVTLSPDDADVALLRRVGPHVAAESLALHRGTMRRLLDGRRVRIETVRELRRWARSIGRSGTEAGNRA